MIIIGLMDERWRPLINRLTYLYIIGIDNFEDDDEFWDYWKLDCLWSLGHIKRDYDE